MKTTLTQEALAPGRRGERGAALVTTLLVAMLVLAMGGALILTTAMTTTTAAEATGESQAYAAAEAGIQATLNVLRGNVAPSPLFATNPTGGVADANKITLRRAITRDTSNLSGDPTSAPIRLSRWLPYSYTPSGGAYADRVPVGPSGSYSPLNGMAYSVVVSDPDSSHLVSFTTRGQFTYSGDSTKGAATNNANGSCSMVFYPAATSANRVTITYTPKTVANANAYPSLASDLGTITVTRTGTGSVSVPAGISFTLTVTQTKPWERSDRYKAIIPTTALPTVESVASTAYMQFDYVSISIYETRYLQTGLLSLPARSLLLGPNTTNTLSATVSAGDPRRLFISSTGYGPRGSKKYIAAMYNRFRFELDPPAPIVIRGADPDPAGTTPAEMTFDLGSSAAKFYTGIDNVGVDSPKATIAISINDWNEGNEGIVKGSTVNDPKLSILDLDTIPNPWPTTNPRLLPTPATVPDSARTPDWLETADKARLFLLEMEGLARTTEVTPTAPNGRYFTSFSGWAGDDDPYDPKFTFVDGDCSLDGGAGLLIVTGNLDLKGNSDFKGVILVLGNGQVTRSGGGNGNIQGSWIVARFIRNPIGAQSRLFLAPSFVTSGGGTGEFEFDSQKVRDANNLMGGGLIGIVEH